MAGIKAVFDSETSRMRVDSRLVRALNTYEKTYVYSKEENIEFLGNGLMGTPRFIFPSTYMDDLYDDIMLLDDNIILKNRLHSLDTVDPSHKVRSNVFNLSCIYIVHRLLTSSMSARQIEEGCLSILKMLHYRFLSSLMVNYFPYEPDKAVMEATFSRLNRKYSLKVQGTWANLIEARCRDIISSGSIHIDTLKKMNDDDLIQYVISDAQGRIREVVKNMYKVFIEVHRSQSKIHTNKSMIEMDGEMHVRDVVRHESNYIRYIHSLISEKNSFIKEELITVILDLMNSSPKRHLVSSLEYCSNNYGRRGDRNVSELVDLIVIHAFEYLRSKKVKMDLQNTLVELKNLYTSPRTNNSAVLKMRELSGKIVSKSTRVNNANTLAALRTSLNLYIALRTLTMNYYSNTTTHSIITNKSN